MDPRAAVAQWLLRARREGASDLHLVAGRPPTVRVDGALRPLDEVPLSAEEAGALARELVPEGRRAALEAAGALDVAGTWDGAGRFRANVHRQGGSWAAAVRLFPPALPDLSGLNLPPVLERLAELTHGLVLVTGPTGSGKSTTLAALLRRILERRAVHAVTIEDPVEFEHPHGTSLVEHVEIGRDAPSFAAALRAALRQDPDVILVGEMRDRESVAIALTAAETGHLVLSTLHTGDAAQTVSRILDVMPASQAEAVRSQVAASLAATVSQLLLPRRDRPGRVPAAEVLVATDAVRNLLRQGKLERIRSQITLEQAAGMLSFEQSLARLARAGLVDPRTARVHARHPAEFDQHYGTGTAASG